MYQKTLERMEDVEATAKYPDNFLLFQRDDQNPSNKMGTILYIGDNYYELSDLRFELDCMDTCVVLEGDNCECSLGSYIRD